MLEIRKMADASKIITGPAWMLVWKEITNPRKHITKLSTTETSMIRRTSLKWFKAIAGGIDSKAITRIKPTMRIATTTVSPISTNMVRYNRLTGILRTVLKVLS